MLNEENITIKTAAERIGISYDNARAICSTYRRQNRMTKVPYEIRTMTRRANKVKARKSKFANAPGIQHSMAYDPPNLTSNVSMPQINLTDANAVKTVKFAPDHLMDFDKCEKQLDNPMHIHSTAAT